MSLRLAVLLQLLIIGNQQLCSGSETGSGFRLLGGSANNNSAYLRFVMLHVSLDITNEYQIFVCSVKKKKRLWVFLFVYNAFQNVNNYFSFLRY